MNVGSLFAGIGGFDLGFERVGMRTVWQVEQNEFCRAVLARHFPDARRFDDVCTVGSHNLAPVDLICGGFPCQDISLAGKGGGIADGARSGLWSEYARIVGELEPRWVVVENVPAITSRGLDRVLRDLAALGYDAEWDCISASAVGAPHRRDRFWLVAYPRGEGRRQDAGRPPANEGEAAGRAAQDDHQPVGSRQKRVRAADGGPASRGREDEKRPGDVADPQRGRRGGRPQRESGSRSGDRRGPDGPQDALAPERGEGGGEPADGRRGGGAGPLADAEGQPERPGLRPSGPRGERGRRPGDGGGAGDWWRVEPDVGRVADGVPARMDRLSALGNALVPQIAEWIGRRILDYEEAP